MSVIRGIHQLVERAAGAGGDDCRVAEVVLTGRAWLVFLHELGGLRRAEGPIIQVDAGRTVLPTEYGDVVVRRAS